MHEGFEGNICGKLRGRRQQTEAVDEAFASAAHVVAETIHQQAYAAVPMETRGLIVEWSGGRAHDLGRHPGAARGAGRSAPGCSGIPEHRIRVIMRDTGGGFGQKVVPFREDMCLMLAARKVPAAVKWIEDRRENLMAAGQARHEHGATAMAFAEDGTILAAHIDHVQDVGAYPTPWPVGTAAAVGMLFPGPYRIPATNWIDDLGLLQHARPHRLPRAVAVRDARPRGAARHRRPPHGHRPGRAAPPQHARRRRAAVRQRATACRTTSMSPREMFEQALEILDYEAFREEQAEARANGRYLGVGTSSYVEPTTTGMGYYGTEGATIRIEPSGKVNVYVAGGSTGNSLETTAVQLTADALGVDIEDVNTIQGDTALTPFGLGTGGSRSGSMIAGRGRRDRGDPPRAHRRHRRPPARGRARPTSSSPHGRASVRGTPSIGLSIAEIATIAYFDLASLPPDVPAGPRGQRPLPRAGAEHLGQRHPRVHLRGRRRRPGW